VLAIAQLTDSIGLGGYLVCSALYFTRIVGLSPAQVGFGLTVGWAVGFLAGVPLGHLADRRGARGVAMLLAASTAAALVLFLLVRSFVPFVVVASLYGASQCGLTAARQALLAALVAPADRTRARAVLQSAINGGIAIGAAGRRARAPGRHRVGLPDGVRARRGELRDLRAGPVATPGSSARAARPRR
jgi:predicted MFS family arabinose efflux permease